MELPVTRDVDAEIAQYLANELGSFGLERGLPPPWPSESDIATLVDLSAGLFVFAATVIHFVTERNSPGPEDQLRAVLDLASNSSAGGNSSHPLSQLDRLYTLILERMPATVRMIARKILLATTFPSIGPNIPAITNLVNITQSQFRNVSYRLYTVLKLDRDRIQFHDASFMEFLQDPSRSGDLCIYSDSAVALRSDLFGNLNKIHSKSSAMSIDIPTLWPNSNTQSPLLYLTLLRRLFSLCQSIPLDEQAITSLTQFDYQKIPVLGENPGFDKENLSVEVLLQNTPRNLREKVVRPYRLRVLFRFGFFQLPKEARWSQPYILGHGNKKALCWISSWKADRLVICPYPSFRDISIFRVVREKVTKPKFMMLHSGQ